VTKRKLPPEYSVDVNASVFLVHFCSFLACEAAVKMSFGIGSGQKVAKERASGGKEGRKEGRKDAVIRRLMLTRANQGCHVMWQYSLT
jgi:hypothetical protein